MKKILYLSLAALLLSITSLADNGVIIAEGVGNYDIQGHSFVLEHIEKGLVADELELAEYDKYLTVLLLSKGAVIADSRENADMIVQYYFDMEEKSIIEIKNIPINGVVGSETTTSQHVTDKSDTHTIIRYEEDKYPRGDALRSSTTTVTTTNSREINGSSSSSTSPIYGAVKYYPVSIENVLYEKSLYLFAYDSNSEALIWKSSFINQDYSSRMLTIMPYFCYFASLKDLGHKINSSGYVAPNLSRLS